MDAWMHCCHRRRTFGWLHGPLLMHICLSEPVWSVQDHGHHSNAFCAGHFIVLTGYNTASDSFLVHDPSLSAGPTSIAADLLDKARQSFGTDEDLLLLELDAVPAAQARDHQQHTPCKGHLPVHVEGPGEVMA